MSSRVFAALACAWLLLAGCEPSGIAEPIPKDPTTDPPPNTPPALPSQIPAQGSADLSLLADQGAATDAVVSFGLPFPQGVMRGERDVTLTNAKGEPVPIATSVLARWPGDGSIRSVLVAFKASLAAGAKEAWRVEWGAPSKSGDAGKLDPNPDGPIVATLPAAHYAKSLVSGLLLPAAENVKFAEYEKNVDRGAARFDVGSFGLDCSSTAGRTYYDSPHARYQRFLRSGVPAHYREARNEARWFRQEELTWYAQRTLAVHKCEGPAWTPERPLDWGTLRQMISQGMLDDFLVTGDPAAREAVIGMGEAFRVNLPALADGDENVLEITERNLAWPLMGLAAYFAVDPRNEVRDAARSLVTRAIAWQARGTSGALEHDLVRPDPDECGRGPSGASPFMTSLVVDGMMDWWLLTADTALVEPFMKKLAIWYETRAITSDKKAFRYLWNCVTEPYDASDAADLNILINHVFGATYVLTKDTHWIDFGDTMAVSGVDAMFAGRAKQFNQSVRSFGKYLGYRSLGAKP
ncbi:MAG: hypothetical protein JST00_32530 [Deltaproteobacteria bacterium]|nr:hypothetical protein [Deltaproteobacteria bacterium]